MSDKVEAARVAWALIKLSEVGTRPVDLAQVAGRVGLAPEEALRLLRLTWREKLYIQDGEIRLDTTTDGSRRYRVNADGREVGSGKGCGVDMYLLAFALGRPIHAEASCPATGALIRVEFMPGSYRRVGPRSRCWSCRRRHTESWCGACLSQCCGW